MEERDHSPSAGGKCNKQGTYTWCLSWAPEDGRSQSLPARTLKVYREALTGLSLMHRPEGLNNPLLPQGYILENGSHLGNGEWWYIPRTGGGGTPDCPGPACRSASSHVLSVTSSNTSAPWAGTSGALISVLKCESSKTCSLTRGSGT